MQNVNKKHPNKFPAHISPAIKKNLFAIFTHSHSHAFKVISFSSQTMLFEHFCHQWYSNGARKTLFHFFTSHKFHPGKCKKEVKNKNYNLICLLEVVQFQNTLARTSAWYTFHDNRNVNCQSLKWVECVLWILSVVENSFNQDSAEAEGWSFSLPLEFQEAPARFQNWTLN